MNIINLTGKSFGRWTVIGRAPNTPQGQALWHCRCSCGNEGTVKSILLRRGISRSCGCLKSELTTARLTKHGHAANGISPTYHSWAGMIARCTDENHKTFPLYGGRGILVCPAWSDFKNFLADMGEKPRGTSLDRIDNNGNYEPSNCRWATWKQQTRNKSNNRILTLNGKSQPIASWADELGLNAQRISERVNSGWTDQEALTTPVRRLSRSHLRLKNQS